MPENPSPILALDPGLRELGFAVLSAGRLLGAGVRPLYLAPRRSRIAEARRYLKGWLTAYRPQVVILERTYRHPTRTFDSVHGLASSLAGVCRRRRVRLVTYAPQTVRKFITGNGNDAKRQAAKVLAARFPELRIHVSNDRVWKTRYWLNLFDALALAVYHQAYSQPPSRSRTSG